MADHYEDLKRLLMNTLGIEVVEEDFVLVDGTRSSVGIRSTHRYISTACHHRVHRDCRKYCKFCHAACRCDCHKRPRHKNV